MHKKYHTVPKHNSLRKYSRLNQAKKLIWNTLLSSSLIISNVLRINYKKKYDTTKTTDRQLTRNVD